MAGAKDNSQLDLSRLIFRLGLGLVVLVYGCQKAFGLFGGHGYAATISSFTHDLHIHPVLANLGIAAEFFGALGVLFGFLTPVAAFSLVCNFAVATYMVAKDGGLHAAFTDPAKSNIVLFPASLFFLSLGIMFLGAGRYSFDAKFLKRGK